MEGIYQLAEKKIQIITLHEVVHAQCRDYRAEGIADFSIEITQADIEYERKKAAKADEPQKSLQQSAGEKSASKNDSEGRISRPPYDGYLESLAVYRKIAEKMPDYDTILMHGSAIAENTLGPAKANGSAIAFDGAAYLFIASSGTGKSTHTRLWRELLGERAVMVNDDKPLIRVTEAGAVIYGTPWDGKHHLSSNIAVPLKAICILTRGTENQIESVTPGEAYPMLLQQVYRPADPAALAKTLSLIDTLAASVSLWHLRCNMDPDAARVSYEAMKGITK